MKKITLLFGALALWATGCPEGGDPRDAPGPGEATLGTGTTTFEALAAGDPLPLIRGPQGGHHFIVHARMRGLLPGDPQLPGLPDNPSTTFSAFLEGGDQIDRKYAPYRLGYVAAPGEPDAFQLPSGRLLVMDEAFVPGLVGQRVRITLLIQDADGRTAEDERWVRVVEEGALPDAAPGASDAGPDGPPDAKIDLPPYP